MAKRLKAIDVYKRQAVETPAAGYTPYEITFDDGEKTTLKNILIGEVWLASGQSNMETVSYTHL